MVINLKVLMWRFFVDDEILNEITTAMYGRDASDSD